MAFEGRRDWRGIGCAVLAGAAIALPIGIVIGGNEAPREHDQEVGRRSGSGSEAPAMRDVYSPRVTTDAYVIEQQRHVLEALELSCRQFGRHCEEARQARLRIEEAEAAR